MIVVFKLLNGDDVIADVDINKDEEDIVVHQPHIIINTAQGLAIVPWCPLVEPDQEFRLDKRDVLCIMDKVKQQIVDTYIKATTGIELVQNKLMVP